MYNPVCVPPSHHPALQAMRAERARQMHGTVARQVLEAISLVEARQQTLMARQALLLQLCQQLLLQREARGGGVGGAANGGCSRASSADGRSVGAHADPSGLGCCGREPSLQSRCQQEVAEMAQLSQQQQEQTAQGARSVSEAHGGDQPAASGTCQRRGQASAAAHAAEPAAPPTPSRQLPLLQPPVQPGGAVGAQRTFWPR